MPKIAKELSAIEVKRLTNPGLHAVGGVAGLLLQVNSSGSRSWILRARIGKLRREIGLGSYPEIPLAKAKERAIEQKDLIAKGIDPIEEKKRARALLLSSQSKAITFDEAADKVHKKKSNEFSNAKYSAQWISAIRTYASPIIGDMHPEDIELAHIVKVLEPIWIEKNDTAKKLRGNIEAIINWTIVSGFRKSENPARWKGHLDAILEKPSKVHKVKHHAAMPVDDMPSFMPQLRKVQGLSARALEFTILTATRSGEVRGAKWDEINLAERVWTVPAERMKARKEYRVPLSDAAIELLKALPRFADNNLVFPSPRGGTLSDMSLLAVLKRMKIDVVPHGFRSTFRDWCGERTNYPHEVAEMALAHTIQSKTERAYRRDDLFPKRALMMQDWANFINTPITPATVTNINSKKEVA